MYWDYYKLKNCCWKIYFHISMSKWNWIIVKKEALTNFKFLCKEIRSKSPFEMLIKTKYHSPNNAWFLTFVIRSIDSHSYIRKHYEKFYNSWEKSFYCARLFHGYLEDDFIDFDTFLSISLSNDQTYWDLRVKRRYFVKFSFVTLKIKFYAVLRWPCVGW